MSQWQEAAGESLTKLPLSVAARKEKKREEVLRLRDTRTKKELRARGNKSVERGICCYSVGELDS